MMTRITIVWVTVLITAVPYSAYYLFFEASREEYALLITFILFWIFGFWAVVGPILSAIKVRNILKALENVRSNEQLREIVNAKESEESLIELIASENKIPKLLAKRLYPRVVKKLAE